jgi:DNA repair exonuclease SbcCD ATPase subunit
LLDDLAVGLTAMTSLQAELATLLEEQFQAMKTFDTNAVARCARRQELLHRRLLRLETERRRNAEQLCRIARIAPDANVQQIADAYPSHREQLLTLRSQLRHAVQTVSERGRRSQRVAGTVLSHLNSVLRMVTKSGLYQQSGSFTAPPPIRRLEASA